MLRGPVRVVSAVLCVGTLCGLSACAAPAPLAELLAQTSLPSVEEYRSGRTQALNATVSNSALVSANTLTVGLYTETTFVPLSYTTQEGSYDGLDIDVAYALGESLGLPVRFVSVNSYSELGKSCDIIVGQSKPSASSDSESNASALSTSVDVSESEAAYAAANLSFYGGYAADALCVFGRTDSSSSAATAVNTDASQLVGAVVGVQEGSTSQDSFAKLELGGSVRGYATLEDAFYALEAGDVSYVVCDALCGGYTASQLQGIGLIGLLSEPSELGVLCESSNTELNSALKQALDSADTSLRFELFRTFWLGALANVQNETQLQNIDEAQQKAASLGLDSSSDGSDTAASDGASDSTGESDGTSSDGATSSTGSGSTDSSTSANSSDKQDGSNAGANAVVLGDTNR